MSVSEKEFMEGFNARNKNTTLDPNTNLPENTTSKSIDYDDFLVRYRYGRKSMARLPLGDKGPNPDEYNFQLKNFADNREIRAINQPTTEILWNAAVNLVGKTGLKTLEGLGYVGSSLGAIVDGNINTMLNNSFSALMSSGGEALSEKFPVYKTNKYLQGDIWEQMSTAGFWFDDAIDGAAFFLSAWATGAGYNALAKGLGVYSKMAKYFNAAAKRVKTGEWLSSALNKGINVEKFATSLDFMTLGAYNVASEAAFEAKDLKDLYLNSKWDEVKDDPEALKNLHDEASAAALNSFKWNTAALIPSNLFELTFMFKKFNRFGKTGGSKRLIDPITGKIEEKTALTTKDYLAKFFGKGITTSLVEGGYEENIQYAIQKMNQDRANNFKFDKSFTEQLEEVLGGMVNNFSDDEGLKNIMLGAIIGFLPGGAGAVREKINEVKVENAAKEALGAIAAAEAGFIHKYLNSEPLTDKDGKPTGKYRILPDKKNGTIFDEKMIQSVLGEVIKNYKSFGAIVKALGSNNPLLVDFAINQVVANEIYKMALSNVSREDAKTAFKFSHKAELEKLKADDPNVKQETIDELDKIYNSYIDNVEKYYDIYESIRGKYGGTYDFGSSKDDIIKRETIASEQFYEAFFQDYWMNQKKELEQAVSELHSDPLLTLLSDLDKDLSGENIDLEVYTGVLGKLNKLEKEEEELTEAVNSKSGEAKTKAEKKLEETKRKIREERRRLDKKEKALLKKANQPARTQSKMSKITEIKKEINVIDEAMESPEATPLIKRGLQKQKDKLLKEKERLESKIKALGMTSLELRDAVKKGEESEFSKTDLEAFSEELANRLTLDVFSGGVMETEVGQEEAIRLAHKYFEINDLLKESYARLKDLMDEEKQVKDWIEEKGLKYKEEREGPEIEEMLPDPSNRVNTSEENGAVIMGKDGKNIFVKKFTKKAAKENGYKVHEKASLSEARRRGDDLKDSIKPYVYAKYDKKTGRYHFIFTDGTEEGNVLREVDYIKRKARLKKNKKQYHTVTYKFDNNKLTGIQVSIYDYKAKKFNQYNLPIKDLPTLEGGKSYTKKELNELYNRISEYIEDLEPMSGEQKKPSFDVSEADRAEAIAEAAEASKGLIIAKYWASDEYDETTPERVFVQSIDTEFIQGFYNNQAGILTTEGDNIIFIPYKEKDGKIVEDEENKVVVSPKNSTKTFKELNFKASLDTLVNVEFSDNGRNITIEGIEYLNHWLKPTDAVKVDPYTNTPVSVTLIDSEGKEHTFKDPLIVEAVAYGIMLSEIVEDKIFDELFAANDEFIILNDKYFVWRKNGEYIIHDENDNPISKNTAEYEQAMSEIKKLVSETRDRLASERLHNYNEQLKKQINEVRRINEILRSPTPEEALKASTWGEVQTTGRVKKGELTPKESKEKEEALKEQIAEVKSEIDKIKNKLEGIKELKKEVRNEVKDAKEKSRNIDDKLKEEQKRIEKLKSELKSLYEELAKTNKEIEEGEASDTVENYVQNINDINAKRAELDYELVKLNTQLEKLNQEIDILSSGRKFGKKKRTVEERENLIKERTRKIKVIKEKIKNRETEKKQLLEALDDLQDKLKKRTELDKKPAELKEKIKDKQEEIAFAEQILSSIEYPVELLTRGIETEEALKELEEEAKTQITLLSIMLKSLQEGLASDEAFLQRLVSSRLGKQKKQETEDKKTKKKGEDVVYLKIEGGEVEVIRADELKDEEYITIVERSNGIAHSATAISYVSESNGKFFSRSVDLERHVIANGVEGDKVVPYIKVRGLDEVDDANILKWWQEKGLGEIREKLENNIPLTEEEVAKLIEVTDNISFKSTADQLPIGLKYITKDGKEIAGSFTYHASDFPIYIPADIRAIREESEAEYFKAYAEYTQKIHAETRKARISIINSLVKGEKLEIDVKEISKGHPNNVGKNQNLADLILKLMPDADLRRASIGIAIDRGYIRFQDEETSAYFGNVGNVFWKTSFTANGEPAIIKLNPARLSSEHAALVLKLMQDIYRVGAANQQYKNPEEGEFPLKVAHVEGDLTRGEILNLLVRQGEKFTKVKDGDRDRKHLKNKQLYVEKLDGRLILHFGEDTMDLFTKDQKDLNRFIEWATTTKNYNITWKLLGENLKYGSFKIGNLSYRKGEDNYTSMILKAGLLQTDVDIYEDTNSVFKNPAVIIDPNLPGIKFTLTAEEEARLKIPKGKLIVKHKPKRETTKKAKTSNVRNESTKKNIENVKENRSTFKTKTNVGRSLEGFNRIPAGSTIYLKYKNTDEETEFLPILEVVEGKDGSRKLKRITTDYKRVSIAPTIVSELLGLDIDLNDLEALENNNKQTIGLFMPQLWFSKPSAKATTETTKEYTQEELDEAEELGIVLPGTMGTRNAPMPTKEELLSKDATEVSKEDLLAPDDLPVSNKPPFMEETESNPEEFVGTRKRAPKNRGKKNIAAEKEEKTDNSKPKTTFKRRTTTGKKIDPDSVDLNDILPTGGFFRVSPTTEEDYEVGNFEEARAWLKEKLGEEIAVRIHKGLIKAKGNKRAFAKILRDGFLLSDRFEVGTEYHEAFHRVSLFYLTPEERADMYNEARRKYKKLKNKSDYEVEEFLAEKFRDYILEKKSGKDLGILKKLGKKIANAFKWLWKTINSLLFREDGSGRKKYEIAQLFENIDKGMYKSAIPLDENIKALDEQYGKDWSIYRLFEIEGVELKEIKGDEEFREVVHNLLYMLVKSSNLLSQDEYGVKMNIFSVDDIRDLNYARLFEDLETTVEQSLYIIDNLSELLNQLDDNPGNQQVIEYVKEKLKLQDVPDDKLHTVIRNKIGTATNLMSLYDEVLSNKELFLKHLEEQLNDLNIQTNRANLGEILDDPSSYDKTVEDLSQMANWNDVAFKFSEKDNTSTLIKLILSLLPESNEINTKTGMVKLVPYGVMWERVMSDFNDLITTDEIMTRLSLLAESNFAYSVLYRHINSNQNIKTQFVRTIRKYKIDFLNALAEVMSGGTVNMDFMGSAVQTLAKQYTLEWGQSFELDSPLFKYSQEKGKLIPDETKLKEVLDRYETLVKNVSLEERKEGAITSLPAFLGELSSLLRTIGITSIDEKQLNAVLFEIDKDPSIAFSKLIKGSKNFTGLSYLFSPKHGTLAKLLRGEIEKDSRGNKIKYSDVFKNESGVRWLAEMIAKHNPTELGYSIFGPGGNRYYSIMANTYLTNALTLYKRFEDKEDNPAYQFVQERLSGVYNQNSDILAAVLVDPAFRENFKFKTLSSFQVINEYDEGREYQTITDIEEFLLRLNVNLYNKNKQSMLMMPTPADRKYIFFVEGLDKLNVFYQDGYKIPDRVLNKFAQYARDEHNRVILTKKQVDDAIKGKFKFTDLVENIHFQPFYSKKVATGEVVLVRGKDNYAEVVKPGESVTGPAIIVKKDGKYIGRGAEHTYFKNFNENTLLGDIEEYFNDLLNLEIKKATELGVILSTRDEFGNYEITGNVLISEDLIKYYKKNTNIESETTLIENILLDNLVNTAYISLEMEKAFFGDPAAFMNAEDMMKRIPQFTSTGDNLRNDFPIDSDVDLLISEDKYNTTRFDDIVFKTQYYNNILEDFINDYLRRGIAKDREDAIQQATSKLRVLEAINETDGQTFIIPELYRALSIKLGEWSQGKEFAFRKLMDEEELTVEDKVKYGSLVMQPLKMQYVKTEVRNGQSYAVIDKMSLATLFPTFIKGSDMQELYDRMQAKGKYKGLDKIHQVKFKSAQKTGNRASEVLYTDENRSILNDFTNLPIEVQDFNFLRQQLNTLPHEQEDYLVGTQVKKSGIADVELLEQYDKTKRYGFDIVSEIHDLLNELANEGKSSIMRELGMNNEFKIINKHSFIDNLRKEAIEANMPSYIVDALQLDEEGKFTLQMDAFPGNRRWIQARILSMIKKSVADLRLPGGVFYQMTSAGLDRVEFENGKGSDRLRVYTDSGLIEAKVSVNLFKKVIPNYNNLTHSERVKWLKARPELTAITYRIPTQGQNSEYAVVIKEFLPEATGNVIILPAEGTAIGGYDFDIDKLYLFMYNYDRHGNKIEYSTSKEEDAIKQRYIDWVKEKANLDIKRAMHSLMKEELTEIFRKYKEHDSNTDELIKEIGASENINTLDDLEKELKDVPDSFSFTPAGREFELTYKKNSLVFKQLPLDIKQRYWDERDILDDQKIRGANRVLAFKDITTNLLESRNIDESVKRILRNMDKSYDKLLNLYGIKDEFIEEHTKEIKEALRDNRREISDKHKFREAEQIAEIAGLPTYEAFKKLSIAKQNTKKAIQNRLIDNYLEIYLNNKHKIYRYQPLEYGTKQLSKMAQKIASKEQAMNEFENKPLGLLTPAYQIEIKSKYKLGSNLGIYALANSHHILGQFADLGLFDYLGIGNSVDYLGRTVTSLSEVYGQEETNMEGVKLKMPITEWFSSLINGHVDLQTDPYIIHLNITKENSDIVSLLLRAGVGINTFWFTAQPVLKELSKKVENRGNKVGIKIFDPTIELIQSYYDRLEDKSLINIEETTEDIFNQMEDIFNPAMLENDIGTPIEDQDDAYIVRQLKVLIAYKALKPYSEALRDAVLSSRDDTKKMGSSYSQMVVYELRRQKVLDMEETARLSSIAQPNGNIGIRNFKNLMSSTFLNRVSKNIYELADGSMNELMIEGTLPFKELLIDILSNIDKKYTAAPRTVDFIANEIYTAINSDYFKEFLSLSKKDFTDLLMGENSIAKKIYRIKAGKYLPEIQNNKLIQALRPVFAEQSWMPDTTAFIKPDSKWSKEVLNRAWRELYLHENDEVANFAVDLFYYSYLTSGFKNNLHSFFEFAPLELLKDMSYDEFIKDRLAAYQNNASLADKFNSIFENGWRNNDLVPTVKWSSKPEYGYNLMTTDKALLTTSARNLLVGLNKDMELVYKPYIKVLVADKRTGTSSYIMYKYAGYLTGSNEAVYYAVNKKGYYKDGYTVREDILDESVFPQINGLPESITALKKYLNDENINELVEIEKNSLKDYLNKRYNNKVDQAYQALSSGFIQVVDHAIKDYKEIDPTVSEIFAEYVSTFENSTSRDPRKELSDGRTRGNYSEQGRGTRQGDEKDKAMRKEADIFIGEVSLKSKAEDLSTDEELYPGSTGYSALKIQEKRDSDKKPHLEYQGTQGDNHRYTVFTISDKAMVKNATVMLARNGTRKGFPLNDATKHNIKLAHDAGARFILGDMPGVDDRFLFYLQEIGADYTVYHGKENRLEKHMKNDVARSKQDTTEQTITFGENYTATTPSTNPSTAYVFTENINSLESNSSRKGSGTAVIRGNKNAVGIVTKKKYVYYENRKTEDGPFEEDFQDTQEDFDKFTTINTKQLDKINEYKSIVFPKAFASGQAILPLRFAEWLQKELLQRFGLVTEVKEIKGISTINRGKIGYGLETIRVEGQQKSTGKPVNVMFSTNENAELSNFALRSFEIKGVQFNTVEEYFQKYKAFYITPTAAKNPEIVQSNMEVVEQITKAAREYAADPIKNKGRIYDIKALGGKNGKAIDGKLYKYQGISFKTWDEKSYNIMFNAILESFLQNPGAAEKLLATGNALITHVSKDGKTYDKNFAKALMAVREVLRENEDETYKDNCNLGGPQKASRGMKTDFTPGSTWSVVKDLKGFPSHKHGGVDLFVEGGTVGFAYNGAKYLAADGVTIPGTEDKGRRIIL